MVSALPLSDMLVGAHREGGVPDERAAPASGWGRLSSDAAEYGINGAVKKDARSIFAADGSRFSSKARSSDVWMSVARWGAGVGADRIVDFEKRASSFRRKLRIYANRIDILRIIELNLPKLFPNFRFVIDDDIDNNVTQNVVAYTQFRPLEIHVSERIYQLAKEGEPRVKFLLAHELAHVVVHSQDIAANLDRLEIDIEIEANLFAAALLVPAWRIGCMSAAEISGKFGVTEAIAKWRLMHANAISTELLRQRPVKSSCSCSDCQRMAARERAFRLKYTHGMGAMESTIPAYIAR